MAEYIEREALGIGKCNPDVFENKGYAEGWNSAVEIMMKAPTADVVEVVHCSQCGKWNKQICKHHGLKTEYYDFCSYGERKEGAEK